MSKKQAILAYIHGHPNASVKDAAKKCGVSENYVYSVRKDYDKDVDDSVTEVTEILMAKAKAKPAPRPTGILRLAAEVPPAGLELKLTHGSRMLGTLLVLPEGIQFAISNQKKRPGRTLSFAVLKSLMDIGFVQ